MRQTKAPAWSLVGAVLGALGYVASLSPTLLPRTTLSQVLASTLVTTTFYAFGAAIEGGARAVARKVARPVARNPQESEFDREPQPKKRVTWPLLAVTVIATLAAASFTPSRMQWQVDQAANIGSSTDPSWLAVVALTLVLTTLLILLGRAIRAFARWIGRRIVGRQTQSHAVRGFVGGAATTVLAIALAVALFAASMTVFNSVNNSTIAGNTQPQSPARSGSPASLISWESLGQQGRLFVDQGPQPAAIASVTKSHALEPIRIFAGVESADGLQAQADLALADLKRAGGLNRSHIILYTPSDNGTVDATAAAAAEYLTNGDVASVAMQYTVMPSFLSYALSQGTSQQAGMILFDTIRNAIDELPTDKRPKLYVYGESLGAFGSQAPFDDGGIPGLVDKVDGALWVGPPSTSKFWDQLNSQATGGTAWQPVVAGGTVVRFAASADAITTDDTEWGPARALYLQNATDPVVWWPGSVLTSQPAWLDNPRGPGVPEQMTWLPVVTFEQMLVDMAFAQSWPQGYGHNYFDQVGPAWTEVLMPTDWTPEKAAALQQALG